MPETFSKLGDLQSTETNHYTTLGLDRDCDLAQIRAAYRLLAKQHHPDLNPGAPEAVKYTQALNIAHETLSDPDRRAAYETELEEAKKSAAARQRVGKIDRVISEEVSLRMEDFLRGTTRDVTVNDPGNPNGRETYQLTVPPDTAPGAILKLPRAEGGFVKIRLKVLPGFRFKARGSDLKCDLKIKPERATQGGTEMLQGINGNSLRIQIPRGAARGEVIRLPGEGLPKPRGGRGDLLVRIEYRVHVQFSRR